MVVLMVAFDIYGGGILGCCTFNRIEGGFRFLTTRPCWQTGREWYGKAAESMLGRDEPPVFDF